MAIHLAVLEERNAVDNLDVRRDHVLGEPLRES